MSRTTVIAFANNKGGSGKTTTASNVGLAMAKAIVEKHKGEVNAYKKDGRIGFKITL